MSSPVEQYMQSEGYQERLARDVGLTDRVKAGYTPATPTDENPHPIIVDGTLDDDGTLALGSLYTAYERLCIGIASKTARRHYKSPGISTEDLTQEALFGVYHSALKWDAESNVSFRTHASRLISNYLARYVDDHETTIRVPGHSRANIRRFGGTLWGLYKATESMPTRGRIASAMGVSVPEVDQIAAWEAETMQMGSINEGYFTDGRDRHSTFDKGEGRWRSAVPGASEMQMVEDEVMISAIVDIVQSTLRPGEEGLTEREVNLLRARFFGLEGEGPMSMEEAAIIFGVTRERIRQIEQKAMAKLRNPVRAHKLMSLIT